VHKLGKLLIFLCDSPFQHESVDHSVEIGKKALDKGHKVSIYLMMDGVYNPLITQSGEPFHVESVSERLGELLSKGAKISGCRVCMELRGVNEKNIPIGIDIGGIFDFSEMVGDADVVLNMVGG
jgi:sulfur relay (sulfurtransferase) complex TusBCD TusD component (DsrE family)